LEEDKEAVKRILSFGGGLQTTAMAIMIASGKLEVDEIVFADTGAEKPETYWYIESYIKPLFEEIQIPFHIIPGVDPTAKVKRNIIEHCYHYKAIPSVKMRWCTPQFKTRALELYAQDRIMLIGFSADETHRKQRDNRLYPLIELNITSGDCRRIISDYGYPIPVKSSCFICPFQRWSEWNWLKGQHPELIDEALAMERRFYEKRPDLKETVGLFGGKPLWKWKQGIQMEMPILNEYSCWSGHCGH